MESMGAMDGNTGNPTMPRTSRWDRVGWWAGVLFLVLQLGLILLARFIPERYFCWAPFDQCTRYTIEVEVGGRRLDRHETWYRYRIQPDAWDQRAAANVLSIMRRYEESLGRGDHAKVTIRYTVNGHPEQTWHWPPHD